MSATNKRAHVLENRNSERQLVCPVEKPSLCFSAVKIRLILSFKHPCLLHVITSTQYTNIHCVPDSIILGTRYSHTRMARSSSCDKFMHFIHSTRHTCVHSNPLLRAAILHTIMCFIMHEPSSQSLQTKFIITYSLSSQ